jgi:transporter family-2 protein
MLAAIVLSLLSGVARTIARMTNAQLAQRVGAFQSTFYNYAVGLACSALALLLSREAAPAAAVSAGPLPPWAYLGGAVGVLFVILSNVTAPKISAFSMTLLIVAGQIGTGLAIDLLSAQQLALGKLAGGALILAGLLGNLLLDRRS